MAVVGACATKAGVVGPQAAGEPAGTGADHEERDRGGEQARAPDQARAPRRLQGGDAQAGRDGLGSLALELGAQAGALAALGRDPLPELGMARQICLDSRAARLVQSFVDERLQLVFANGNVFARHFTLRSRATGPFSTIERSLCLALDSLDITVPIGTPRMRAASS